MKFYIKVNDKNQEILRPTEGQSVILPAAGLILYAAIKRTSYHNFKLFQINKTGPEAKGFLSFGDALDYVQKVYDNTQ